MLKCMTNCCVSWWLSSAIRETMKCYLASCWLNTCHSLRKQQRNSRIFVCLLVLTVYTVCFWLRQVSVMLYCASTVPVMIAPSPWPVLPQFSAILPCLVSTSNSAASPHWSPPPRKKCPHYIIGKIPNYTICNVIKLYLLKSTCNAAWYFYGRSQHSWGVIRVIK